VVYPLSYGSRWEGIRERASGLTTYGRVR